MPFMRAWMACGLAVALSFFGCASTDDGESASAESEQNGVGSLGVPKPSPDRVVAIGDLHGDIDAARRALRLAGAIDARDKWAGGKLVLVQTGDQIDREDHDRDVIDLFERLKTEAKAAGGEVIALSGNHEIMNASFDFRYVTKGGFEEFADVPGNAPPIEGLTAADRGRAVAFMPGGPYAKILATRPVVARVGDTIFVHGGVLGKHVRKGLDGINDGVRKYLEGTAATPPSGAVDDDGVVWTRAYSDKTGQSECVELRNVLVTLKAARMVVGHTVQERGMTSACDGQVIRIDTGMSKFYGGPIQALQIAKDGKLTALTER